MSKNKDIEALHKITGEPYRICRAKMKANNWELLAALGFYALDKVQGAVEAFGEAFHSWIDDICETLNSIDWAGLMEAALELKRQQDERLIQCNAEHCTTDPEGGCENCAGYEPVGGWIKLPEVKDGTQ